MHALARPLIEDRGKIRRADPLGRLQRGERHVRLDQLVGIERVDAARAPGWLRGEQREEPRAPHHEAFAQGRDDVPAIDRLLPPAELRPGRVHRRDQAVGREALVGTGVEQETDEAIEIEVVGRHAGNDAARSALRVGRIRRRHGAGVAGGAVEPNDVDAAIDAPRDADRQVARPAVAVVLVEEAERRIILAAREGLGEEARQHLPDAEWDAAVRLGADRAVFELLDDVGVVRRAVLRELREQHDPDDGGRQPEQDDQRDHDVDRNHQPPAPMQRVLDRGDGLFAGHSGISSGVGTRRTGCAR